MKHKPLDRAANDPCYKIGVTLRDALAEILTAPILAERPDRRIETEYIVAEALFRIRQGHRDSPAGKAIIAWCRRHASVWVIEDGDRRLEAPPPLDASETQPHIDNVERTVDGLPIVMRLYRPIGSVG